MDIIVRDGEPYVAFTHERIEATKRALEALETEQKEYRTIKYPTKRDLEIEKASSLLQAMIDEAEQQSSWEMAAYVDDKKAKPDGA